MILQRAGDDFRGRSRTAVDQNDERLGVRKIARTRVIAHRFVGVATARRNDLAVIDERVHDGDRLIEQTARIVAQVEDIALQLVVRDIRLEFQQRVADAIGGLLVELRDPDIADIVALFRRADGFNFDDRTGQLDIARVALWPAQNFERHDGVGLAAHLVDGLVQGHAVNCIAVDRRDNVARENARA